jgi:hypothetical protein
MKTPKLLATIPILALSASAVIAWSAFSRASQADNASAKTNAPGKPISEAPADQARIARMEAEQKRLAERLRVSSPMEREIVNGKDLLADAVSSGYLIEVTAEQVEKALQDASLTATLEDDKAALDLLHRGTFRFFAPE